MDEFSPESRPSPPHCRQESSLASNLRNAWTRCLGAQVQLKRSGGKKVMFASSASAGSRIEGRQPVPDASCLFPGLHQASSTSCDPRSFLNNATETMANPRTSYVVLKPVCTPVPPVRYGYAAGDAGYAPPRIRVVRKDSAHPGSQRQRPCPVTNSIRTRRETRIHDGKTDAQHNVAKTTERILPFTWDFEPSPLPPRSERIGDPARAQCPGTVRRHSPRHCLARRAYCGSGR